MIKAYYRCLLLLKQKNLRLVITAKTKKPETGSGFFVFNMTALA